MAEDFFYSPHYHLKLSLNLNWFAIFRLCFLFPNEFIYKATFLHNRFFLDILFSHFSSPRVSEVPFLKDSDVQLSICLAENVILYQSYLSEA